MSEAFNAPKVKLVPWWLVLIEGILLIIVGILLLTRPLATWSSLVWVIGLYWFISGIFNLVKLFWDRSMWGWKIFAGIVGIIAGYFLITNPWGGTFVFSATVVLMLGLFGIFIGIANLIQAFRGAGWGTGILGVVSIILGIIILSNQQAFLLSLPWAIGILAIIGGIIAIFNSFRIRGAKKDIEEAAAAAQSRAAQASRSVSTSASAAGAAAVGAAAAAGAAMKDTAGDAADAVDDAVDDAGDMAGDAMEAVGDMADDAMDAAGDMADDAADAVGDAAKGAGAAAAGAAAAVADAADDAMDAAGDMADDAAGAVSRTFDFSVEPDDELAAAVAAQFPNLSAAAQGSIAGLVAAVRSLDPADAEKLRQAGIDKASTLLERGATRAGRNELSKATGIDASIILKWVNDLDLKRVKGIGVLYSNLLEVAGVDTVVELAQRNPANLYQKLVEVNEAEELVESLPSEEEVADWVDQASDLPRVITY
jgi:uncharacterized membrane protein HdeD (DUF308 family)